MAELKGDDVVCVIKNSATLSGALFTLHISQIRIDLPTLTDSDKNVSCCISEHFSLLYLPYLRICLYSFYLLLFPSQCWFKNSITSMQSNEFLQEDLGSTCGTQESSEIFLFN